MTKTNGLVLAAFLMASTSPMAIGQTTTPDPGTEPTPLPGDEAPMDTEPTPLPGDDAPVGAEPTPLPGEDAPVGTDMTTQEGMMDQLDDNRDIINNLSLGTTGELDWETQFSGLSPDAEIRVVTLSELRDADDPTAPILDQVMPGFEADRENLHAAIEGNETLLTALEDEGHSVEDVVAAVVQPGAEIEATLVVDDNGADMDFDTEVEAEGEADL
ncbi:hypothetical protein [Yoonia sp.]|uniref:hypothetical protein n=1 Tax=Yoonia sp. TaxID=2212373 RepID=UPI00391BD129